VSRVRHPAVAGSFYPADPEALRSLVRRCLAEGRERQARGASREAGGSGRPKALIVPHAGYVYSGPVAGRAYAELEPIASGIRRVVLLGPSHRVGFHGLALSSAERFATPLGDVTLDTAGARALAGLAQVRVLDAAHAEEHSLEVQLPFLQEVLGEAFTLLPLAAGDATASEVAQVIEAVWGGPETLILISTDLSHYHDYQTARSLDEATSAAIEALRPEALDEESACGRVPVRGMLMAARARGLAARTLDLRSSGDTAGPRDRVVGYGAYAFA
jgi:AmmeMemoRadiSam system protein B